MLTMKAKYALRALAVLAEAEPAPRQARQIAAQALIPGKFLEAILVELRKAGLVESRRGALGGHRLSRPAAQITIGEIVRSIDGPIAPLRCASVTAYRPCADCADPGHCALRLLMGDVREAMSEVIDRRSLRELSDDTQRLVRTAATSKPTPHKTGGTAWTPAAP
jgi:Rrf2 family protein